MACLGVKVAKRSPWASVSGRIKWVGKNKASQNKHRREWRKLRSYRGRLG